MNTFFKAGEWHNTNAPAVGLSSSYVGFGHRNTEYSIFDFQDPSVTPVPSMVQSLSLLGGW